MIQEQYLSVCAKEMVIHLKKGKPKFIQKLEEKAENYMEAHATDVVFGIDPKPTNIRSQRPETCQCHNCKVGHVRSQYPEPSSLRSVRETFSTPTSPQTSPRQRRQTQHSWSSSDRQCRNCQRFGHLQHQCPTSRSPRGLRKM